MHQGLIDVCFGSNKTILITALKRSACLFCSKPKCVYKFCMCKVLPAVLNKKSHLCFQIKMDNIFLTDEYLYTFCI